MGRPIKYATEEARKNARRKQLKDNLQRFRARRNAELVDSSESASHTSTSTPANTASTLSSWHEEDVVLEEAECAPRAPSNEANSNKPIVPLFNFPITEVLINRLRAATSSTRASSVPRIEVCRQNELALHSISSISSIEDIESFSSRPVIDLSFGTFDAIIHDFSEFHQEWPWLQCVKTLRTRGRFTSTFVFAAGTQWLGRFRKDDGMIQSSFSAYQTALHGYRQSFATIEMNKSEEVLAMLVANVAIIGIEFCASAPSSFLERCSDERGEDTRTTVVDLLDTEASAMSMPAFLPHVFNGGDIMTQGGPQAFTTEIGLQILRAMRGRMTFVDLFKRRASALDSEEWRMVPFEKLGAGISDKLWNLFMQVPGIIARTDVQMKRSTTNDGACFDIDEHGDSHYSVGGLEQLWIDVKCLQQAFEDWLTTDGRTLYCFESNVCLEFGGLFQFTSFENASNMADYWMFNLLFGICVLHIQSIRQNHNLQSTPTGDSYHTTSQTASTPILTAADLITYAYNILRCIPALLATPNTTSPESFAHTTFLLRVVIAYLSSADSVYHKHALDWCDMAIVKIHHSRFSWMTEYLVANFFATSSREGLGSDSVWAKFLGSVGNN